MRYKLAIFDLDGTLADSFAWFLRHCNDVADRYGFRRMIENGELTPFGHELRHAGSREILTRLDLALWKLPLISRHVRRLKTAHIDDITLFPGTTEMLRALKDHGLTLALVSSDNEKNVRRQLGAANAALFSHYACGASLFGKARKFRRVMRRAGVGPEQAIAIGDEVRDVEAARAAGLACGAVSWGYAAPEKLRALAPDLVFERMEEIAHAIC